MQNAQDYKQEEHTQKVLGEITEKGLTMMKSGMTACQDQLDKEHTLWMGHEDYMHGQIEKQAAQIEAKKLRKDERNQVRRAD